MSAGRAGALHVSTGGPAAVDPALLEGTAAALGAAAEELVLLAADAVRWAASPQLLVSAPAAPASAWVLAAAVHDLLLGPRSAPAAAAETLALAGRLRLAALRYRVGEEAAGAAVAAARRATAGLVVEAAPGLAVGAAAVVAADALRRVDVVTGAVAAEAVRQARAGALDPAGLERLAVDTAREQLADAEHDARALAVDVFAAHPGLTREVVALTPHLVAAAEQRQPLLGAAAQVLAPGADDDVAGVAGAVVAAGGLAGALGGGRRTDAVAVRPVAGRAAPVRPAAGLAELLDGVAQQSTGWPPGRESLGGRVPGATTPPPGSLRVERVTGAGGEVAWAVAVPGTQEWGPVPGANPMDLTTNVRAVAGQDTATAGAVVQALRAAGAAPGEPVLLAGHSQGGLTVSAVAADPAVRREFTITHVVTAGAPTDTTAVPADVRVLSLEHVDDVVPALDGADAPASDSRTVVRRDTGASGGPDPLAAHASSAYVATAALADRSDDPALVAFRDSAALFWDRPGARVQVFDYTAERLPRAAAP
ncbi:hypothetical protein [Kineococcus sp. SYSU DK004]|uniref:hypothetical protein n=1 Tax=Kineococcus sp. SYSU DK004 TaxID=3383125 RepID=UPI003D7D5F82